MLRSIPRASLLLFCVLLPLVCTAFAANRAERGRDAALAAVPATELAGIRVYLRRPSERQAALDRLTAAQLDRGSPEYHRWRNAESIGRDFGPSQRTVTAVADWLRTNGLRVTGVARSRLFLTVAGDIPHVERAFHTNLNREVLSNGSSTLWAQTAPAVPARFAGVVLGVSGLSGRRLHAAARVKPSYTACYSVSDCEYFLAPADFVTIYDVGPVYQSGDTGQGQTIAVVGRSRVYADDISEFEANTGLASVVPAVTIPPNGADPGTPNNSTSEPLNDDQTEATLDVDRTLGTAPGAVTKLVVSADTPSADGVELALEYAIDEHAAVGANILNVSYAACEASVSASDVTALDALFQQAAAEGITVLVASGDAGAAGCDTPFGAPPAAQARSANYLCASSYVTCVGGTEFNDAASPATYWNTNNSSTLGSALTYIPEGAWNEPETDGAYYAAASGGGASAYIATPTWQAGNGVPGTAGRYTPDVAFSASAHDGYYGCYAAAGGDCLAGRFAYFYGTSAAAPSMAGIVALLDAALGPQGNLNPVLYGLAAQPGLQVFHDATVVTSGVSGCSTSVPAMCNNSTPSANALTGGLTGFALTPGFDLVTGWGSIDTANLIANWKLGEPATTAIALSASPGSSFDSGTTVVVTAKVTSAAGTPTGAVRLTYGSQLLGTAALSGGSGTLRVPTAGLPAGTYTVQAEYTGAAGFSPSGISATATVYGTTTTTIATSAASLKSGGSVTFSATVSSAAGSPAGSVSFYSGSLLIETTSLVGGRAAITVSSNGIPPGTYPVNAIYVPSGLFDGSRSGSVNVTITP